jgi:hypothetical protein
LHPQIVPCSTICLDVEGISGYVSRNCEQQPRSANSD